MIYPCVANRAPSGAPSPLDQPSESLTGFMRQPAQDDVVGGWRPRTQVKINGSGRLPDALEHVLSGPRDEAVHLLNPMEETAMARRLVDKEVRRVILDARRMIQQAEKSDCNEAETRRRVERIFESVMGYDVFRHLSREHAVRGAGESEHVDFTIQLGEGDKAKPVVMVEIKRVGVDLAPKHLRQASSYAINAGSEWILLTNAKEWRLYHVSFGQPPVTKLVHSWNVLTDDVSVLAQRFDLISYRSVRKGGLDDLWQKTNVMHPRSLLQAILSEPCLKAIRRELRKGSGVLLSPEEVMSGVRRLLNETALSQLENVRITLPERRSRRRRRKKEEKHLEIPSHQEPTQPPAHEAARPESEADNP